MIPNCVAVCTFIVSSPIGDIKIQACEGGLHSVKQCATDDTTFNPDESCAVEVKSQPPKKTQDPKASDISHQCVRWLQNYFMHRIASTDIPSLCQATIKKDSFRSCAWSLLPEAVPFGSKITYAQLADLCGNKHASRAAGQAMAMNPVSLLIPCHRVIPSHGGAGNYHHGRKNLIKVWLLHFEEVQHHS